MPGNEINVADLRVGSSRAESDINKVERSLKRVTASGKEAGREVRRGQRQIQRSMLQTQRVAITLRSALASIGLGFGLAKAVQTLEAFEASMSAVQAITGQVRSTATDAFGNLTQEAILANAAVDALGSTARDLGATTIFTASQAADGMKLLAQAGFNANEILRSIRGTLDLAAAGMIDLAKAASITASTVRGFALDASEASRVADVLAKTATSSNTTILDLGEALKFVAPVAATVGRSVEEVSAALGILGNVGLRGTIAGTALRRIFVGLAEDTQKVSDSLNRLGLDFEKVDPRANNLITILRRLRDGGLDLNETFTIFGVRGGPAALALSVLAEDVARLQHELETANGAASEMARIMQDNLRGAVLRLSSATQELILDIGDAGLLGFLRNTVDETANVIRAMAGVITPLNEANLKYFELAERVKFLAGVGGLVALGLSIVTVGRFIDGMVRQLTGAIGALKELRAGSLVATAALKSLPLVTLTTGFFAIGAAIGKMLNKQNEIPNRLKGIDDQIEQLRKLEEAFNNAGQAAQTSALPTFERDINKLDVEGELALQRQEDAQDRIAELIQERERLSVFSREGGSPLVRFVREALINREIQQLEGVVAETESTLEKIDASLSTAELRAKEARDRSFAEDLRAKTAVEVFEKAQKEAQKRIELRRQEDIRIQIQADIAPEGIREVENKVAAVEKEFRRRLEAFELVDVNLEPLDIESFRKRVQDLQDQIRAAEQVIIQTTPGTEFGDFGKFRAAVAARDVATEQLKGEQSRLDNFEAIVAARQSRLNEIYARAARDRLRIVKNAEIQLLGESQIATESRIENIRRAAEEEIRLLRGSANAKERITLVERARDVQIQRELEDNLRSRTRLIDEAGIIAGTPEALTGSALQIANIKKAAEDEIRLTAQTEVEVIAITRRKERQIADIVRETRQATFDTLEDLEIQSLQRSERELREGLSRIQREFRNLRQSFEVGGVLADIPELEIKLNEATARRIEELLRAESPLLSRLEPIQSIGREIEEILSTSINVASSALKDLVLGATSASQALKQIAQSFLEASVELSLDFLIRELGTALLTILAKQFPNVFGAFDPAAEAKRQAQAMVDAGLAQTDPIVAAIDRLITGSTAAPGTGVLTTSTNPSLPPIATLPPLPPISLPPTTTSPGLPGSRGAIGGSRPSLATEIATKISQSPLANLIGAAVARDLPPAMVAAGCCGGGAENLRTRDTALGDVGSIICDNVGQIIVQNAGVSIQSNTTDIQSQTSNVSSPLIGSIVSQSIGTQFSNDILGFRSNQTNATLIAGEVIVFAEKSTNSEQDSIFGFGSAQHGGLTTKEGLLNVHPQEAIVPLNRLAPTIAAGIDPSIRRLETSMDRLVDVMKIMEGGNLAPSGAGLGATQDRLDRFLDSATRREPPMEPPTLRKEARGPSSINVSIKNQSGDRMGVKESSATTDSNGDVNLEIVIDQIVAKNLNKNSNTSRALENRFKLDRKTRSR